jgi:hypothetical protein
MAEKLIMPVMPTAEELLAAAWRIQGWIASCFDVAGVCSLCGTADPRVHVNKCPWPEMRALLDRSIGAGHPA